MPFAFRGYSGWLTDTELLRFSAQLWISFLGDTPKQLVHGVLAAVLPDVAPHWFGTRALVFELKHRDPKLTTDSSGYKFGPDLAKLQQIVSRC